ncbi:MAG: helix-turn-helix domain-containing protein [Lachnospiraceae bacterium]|nr:helix-turn-helix domain-containing protein [Lachnospiraceae bacterium]
MQKMTIRQIAGEVKRTPTYISDIERGNNKPPEKALMEQIIEALKLPEKEVQNYLYDLAAKERGGVSEDIVDYIMENSTLRLAIRMAKNRENSEEVWEECVKKLQN